ncbi:AraC family transcriptional regulator [Paenibacillus sp. GCM10023252]|uniref:AraC family transcriptional regulator n=1 Tax=Paenibacillus sp. GCM10023252 TaxID=3252649 RepID=UPI00361FAEFA
MPLLWKPRTRSDATSFYARVFTVLTITIVATIVILSTILYLNFEDIALRQTYEQTVSNLEQTSQDASVMTVTAASFAKQIYNDVQVTKLLNNLSVEAVDAFNVINQMNAYRATSPFIDSIYVYNAQQRTFYVSSDLQSAVGVQREEEVIDQELVSMVGQLNKYEALKPIPRQMKVDNKSNPEEKLRDTYTFLLFDTLANQPRQNAVIINMSETHLHKKIDGLLTQSKGNTFIINEEGRLMSSSWKYPILSSVDKLPYIQEILSKPNSSGYVRGTIEGKKAFFAYTQPDSLGWRYIRILPYGEINAQINQMRMKTIAIAGSILLAGLLLSYIISRKLFVKVDKKLEQLNQLEAEQRDSLHILRQEYMRNVLLGWEKKSDSQLDAKFKKYNIAIEAGSPAAMVYIRLDRYQEFVERFSSEDRKLYKFAIMNIAQEVLSKDNQAFAVDMGDDRIAVILTGESLLGSDLTSLLLRSIKQLQFNVYDWLKLSVTAVFGASEDGISGLPALYNQLISASYHRFFYGYESIIDAEKLHAHIDKPYSYPAHKEKQLIDELMLGRTEEVKRLFHEMMSETADYPFVSFQLAFSQLSLAVNNTIATISQYSGSAGELHLPQLHTVMDNHVETLEEITRKFYTLFDELAAKLEEKRKTKHDDLVGSVMDLVDTKYTDQNLSLDTIAEELGMSATYIGRIFKQHTLKTILGYINEVRMNSARELLVTTDLPIGEVAERTGFSNSPYFFKAFKKVNGVTPVEYRKHARSAGSRE